jgi:transcriptional regulator with XRE-family HTH domain
MLTMEFARRQKGITQHDLGKMTGVASHFISLMENGRGTPTDKQARLLAEALCLPIDSLMVPMPEISQMLDRETVHVG